MCIRDRDYYGTTGIIHQTEAIQHLTDKDGQAFREQVISYMEQRTGVDAVNDIVDLAEDWEIQEIEGEKVQGKEEAAVKNYEDLLAESEEAVSKAFSVSIDTQSR